MSLSSEALLAAANLPAKTQRALHRSRQTESKKQFEQRLHMTLDLFPDAASAVEEQLNYCSTYGIDWITLYDSCYPMPLQETAEAPFVLFYRGNLDTLHTKPRVAIVGSRNANQPGLRIAESTADYLSKRGACIISGLALGVDAAAHSGAVGEQNYGKTIAVLAHGLDSLYPKSNQKLADQILGSGGLLISQFPPEVKPFPAHFLIRNMVIAGLAECTLVVQAGERSGSLVTARFAFESGREVCAVPGFPGDPRHAGTNKLIKQGAHLIENAEDLAGMITGLKELDVEPDSQSRTLNSNARVIVKTLYENGSTHFSTLHEAVGGSADFHSELLQLQLDGIIHACGGNKYALNLTRR